MPRGHVTAFLPLGDDGYVELQRRAEELRRELAPKYEALMRFALEHAPDA